MRTITTLINEASINAKKRDVNVLQQMIMGGREYKAIKSFAVFTAENPNSTTPANKNDNKKLLADLKKTLKNDKVKWVDAQGKFGNVENSVIVFNISCDTAKLYTGKYEQTSFIYSYSKDGKLVSEYWEKDNVDAPYDKVSNDYVKKDTCDTKAVDMKDADDYYTIVGKKFKYSIPFSIFESVDGEITNNINEMLEAKFGGYTNFNSVLNWGINHTGMRALRTREKMNS